MKAWGRISFLLCLALLADCSPATSSITEPQAIDIAWQTLEPYTNSHQRGYWQAAEVQTVTGKDLPVVFQKPRDEYCFGSRKPAGEEISSAGRYWFIEMRPIPATAIPETPLSPTAPPRKPEPFIPQAFFLIDRTSGSVAGFRIQCVVY